MASQPPSAGASPRELMTLGMFIFGMETLPYQNLRRQREWRHATAERHGARDASQYVGPGPEAIELSGLLVPELGATYSSMATLAAIADTGDAYPLIDGTGLIFGHYYIVRMEEEHLSIMAGGVPRHVGFRVELARADDDVGQTVRSGT